MSEMSTALTMVAGGLLASAAWFVLFGYMANLWRTENRQLRAEIRDLKEENLDLKEGMPDRKWMSKEGGVDDIVLRGRPDDIRPKREYVKPELTPLIDLKDIEDF